MTVSRKKINDYEIGYCGISENQAGIRQKSHIMRGLAMRLEVELIANSLQDQAATRKIVAGQTILENGTSNRTCFESRPSRDGVCTKVSHAIAAGQRKCLAHLWQEEPQFIAIRLLALQVTGRPGNGD
jgi:hypothetical protein